MNYESEIQVQDLKAKITCALLEKRSSPPTSNAESLQHLLADGLPGNVGECLRLPLFLQVMVMECSVHWGKSPGRPSAASPRAGIDHFSSSPPHLLTASPALFVSWAEDSDEHRGSGSRRWLFHSSTPQINWDKRIKGERLSGTFTVDGQTQRPAACRLPSTGFSDVTFLVLFSSLSSPSPLPAFIPAPAGGVISQLAFVIKPLPC